MSHLQGPDGISLELEKIASVVATARRLINDKRAVDLSALQTKAAVVCQAVIALPREQGRTFLPALEQLMESLDALEADLRHHFAPLLDAADAANHTPAGARNAAAAYGRTAGPRPAPSPKRTAPAAPAAVDNATTDAEKAVAEKGANTGGGESPTAPPPPDEADKVSSSPSRDGSKPTGAA